MKALYPLISKSKKEVIWHARRVVEIAPDSPRGYEALGEQAWDLNGRVDELIRWETKAAEIDPKQPEYAKSIGRAYSALGDPEMALAYFDLARALTASDNERQHELLLEQAIIRLVSGEDKADQVAELQALLSESTKFCILMGGSIYRPGNGETRGCAGPRRDVFAKVLGGEKHPG